MKKIPGILLAFLIAGAAFALGREFPVVGGAVFGILFGILIKNSIRLPETTADGIRFTSRKVLQYSIILLGGSLSFGQIAETGSASLYLMLFTIIAAFAAAFLVGRIMGIGYNLMSLIGVGTAICGGSAIAAVSTIIKAEDHEIAYSISTIFLFNVVAVLIFPPLGHLLGLSDYGFGLFAGTAINDTSSVVAAGYIYSDPAGDYATIVKLTRTVLIIPIAVMFSMVMAIAGVKGKRDGARVNIIKIFPWFVLGFLGMAVLNSVGVFSAEVQSLTKESGKFMIVMALAAIGMQTDFRKMLQTGYKPLLLGFLVWIAVAGTSLAVQLTTGQM
jgi:uncharacterized integral membrane protein (TIGR00698 family)